MRNIFLEKTYTKCGGELFPDPFLKNQNWRYLWINRERFIQFVFIVRQVESYQNILKLSSKQLSFTSYKAFLNNKKRSGTSFPASFSVWFLEKNIFLAIFYKLTKFHCLVTFTLWDLGIVIVCWPGCEVTNFEINHIFLIKPFFLHD